MISPALLRAVRPELKKAIREDAPTGDITSVATVPAGSVSKGVVVAKEEMVLAGLDIFREVMKIVDENLVVKLLAKDSQSVRKGIELVRVSGRSRSILKGERVALNYLQRMCGIATLTWKFAQKVKGTKAKILDTRKTTPNMRLLEKYAVTCGGGFNHRFSLSDAPLIKENHIAAAGSIAKAVKGLKKVGAKPIILEVTNRQEVLEGLAAKADILLLDNMTPAKVKKMVKLIAGKALVEVSGGVSLKSVRSYALAGADRISIGSITHSAPSSDLSLLFL
jgi:nicotinate-nucleotide pyrophosphorylase (carboxylating)